MIDLVDEEANDPKGRRLFFLFRSFCLKCQELEKAFEDPDLSEEARIDLWDVYKNLVWNSLWEWRMAINILEEINPGKLTHGWFAADLGIKK